MTQKRTSDTTPDILELSLYCWSSESKWSLTHDPLVQIRFKIIGRPMGGTRWRPDLIQHKDPLSSQTSKESSQMIKTLKEKITSQTGLSCTPITLDLFDDISGDNNGY
jgi:hypothetical protein